MTEATKDVRSEQSGSHPQSGQPGHSPSDQKQGDQSRENQLGKQIPKKDVHGEKQDEENQKTGKQTGTR